MALLWLPLWLPVRTLDKFKSSPDPSRSGGPDADASSSAISIAVGDDGKASSSGGGGSGGASLWALLQRREVWAICAAQYGQSWGMYGLLNWLPTFFADFYKVELADLGSYTLLPYVFQVGRAAVQEMTWTSSGASNAGTSWDWSLGLKCTEFMQQQGLILFPTFSL